MPDFALDLAIKILSPILVGFLTPFIVDAAKRASAWLDQSPAYIKQGLAVGIATIATTLTGIFGVGVPTDLAAWDSEVIKGLVAGFLAIAIKQHKQLKKAQK